MTSKRRFDVSLRMTVFFGPGTVPTEAESLQPLRLMFAMGDDHEPALAAVGTAFPDDREVDIVFLVDPAGCREVLGDAPDADGIWHLDSDQRRIARAILDCDLPDPAAQTLRTVRAVELLWSVTAQLREGRMVPSDGGGRLGEFDTRRLMVARRLIDEGWAEKLTLDGIARASALNRVKLTSGFRAMFGCTVAEAIAERRLSGARQLLLVTDLPVASVGYRCGYSNNASFTRAFSRRFGVVPTQLRAGAAVRAAA